MKSAKSLESKRIAEAVRKFKKDGGKIKKVKPKVKRVLKLTSKKVVGQHKPNKFAKRFKTVYGTVTLIFKIEG